MAQQGRCKACGQTDDILPSIARGRECAACGGELEPTGVPQAATPRYDKSRFCSDHDQAVAARHKKRMEHHRETHKADYDSGRFEVVPLAEAMGEA